MVKQEFESGLPPFILSTLDMLREKCHRDKLKSGCFWTALRWGVPLFGSFNSILKWAERVPLTLLLQFIGLGWSSILPPIPYTLFFPNLQTPKTDCLIWFWQHHLVTGFWSVIWAIVACTGTCSSGFFFAFLFSKGVEFIQPPSWSLKSKGNDQSWPRTLGTGLELLCYSTYNKLLSLVALSAVSVSFALLLPHVLISFSSPVTLYGHNLSFLFVCAFAAAHTALLLISQAHPSLSLLHF